MHEYNVIKIQKLDVKCPGNIVYFDKSATAMVYRMQQTLYIVCATILNQSGYMQKIS